LEGDMTTTIEDLERRVVALEAAQKHTAETQEWMAATLGRIAAVQDSHTKTLNDHTQRLDRIETDIKVIKTDIKGLRDDLPAIIAETMREVLREQRS
jgi:cell division protein FtsB